METDGDYRTRFQLLEMLGRLEAEAAVHWAEKLRTENTEGTDALAGSEK